MRYFLIYIQIALLTVCCSRNNSSTDIATKWTNEIRSNIIEDAGQPYDQFILDTAQRELVYLKNNKKLKYYGLKPRLDQEIIISFDTAVSISYSADQMFELVKEHCPVSKRNFEGIRYNGYWVGRLEYRYCDGSPKNIHFSYKETLGVEREYDSNGKLIKEINHGNTEKLERLREIKYQR